MKKIISFIKKNYVWILLFIFLLNFFTIMSHILFKEILVMDTNVYSFISNNFINDNLNPFVVVLTTFGSAMCFIPLSILLFFLIKNRKVGLSIIMNLVCSFSINSVVKILIQRPRPNINRIVSESGFSFPSGHSMVSMAVYGFLIYLIYKYIKNKKIKISLIIFLSLLIVIIGLSRIYLGVHYFSDVLGGFTLALSYLILYIKACKRFLKIK